MSLSLEKYLSVFIKDHLPEFYKEEGEDFVAFIRAYFEYLEQINKPIYDGRRLLEYRDIDLTVNEFVQNFVEKYLAGIPETVVLQPTNIEERKRFLIKHIYDLYRSKGTERGYKLLFRLLFNEDIEVEIPGDRILRASDGIFKQPAFIEVTPRDNLSDLIGTRIVGTISGSTALVESIRNIYVSGREITIIDISDVTNRFQTGEYITDRNKNVYTDATNAPKITGSLTRLNVVTGGANFQVGDLVSIESNSLGFGGTAVVRTVDNLTGAVTLSIVDGGSGYKVEQTVTDSESEAKTWSTSNLQFQTIGPLQSLTVNDGGSNAWSVPKFSNGTIATLSQANAVQAISYAAADDKTNWDAHIGTTVRLDADEITGNTTLWEGLFGSTGAIGDFNNDGSITSADATILEELSFATKQEEVDWWTDTNYPGRQAYLNFIARYFYVDWIEPSLLPYMVTYNSVNLDGSNGSNFKGYISSANNGVIEAITVLSNGSSYSTNGSFTIGVNSSIYSTVGYGNSENSNAEVGNVAIAEAVGSNITFTIPGSGFSAEIGSVTDTEELSIYTDIIGANNENGDPYLTIQLNAGANGYGFPGDPAANLQSVLEDTFVTANVVIGAIASFKNITVGSGYLEGPLVKAYDNEIASLNISDGEGGIKGDNANIVATAATADATVTELAIVTSGVGYREGDQVTLSNDTNPTDIVATVSLGYQGTRQGTWEGTQGLLTNANRIQDSYFYQEYSYNVKSERALEKYKDIAKNVIHPAGVALFGTLENNDKYDRSPFIIVSSTITTDLIPGSYLFSTVGTHSFVVPDGVTSICAVCVGGGGGALSNRFTNPIYYGAAGGGGGGLSYANFIPVTPGETLTIVVGAGGTPNYGNVLGSTYATTLNYSGSSHNGGDSLIKRDTIVLVGATGGKAANYTSASNVSGAGGFRYTGALYSDGSGYGGAGGYVYADSSPGGGGGGAGGYGPNATEIAEGASALFSYGGVGGAVKLDGLYDMPGSGTYGAAAGGWNGRSSAGAGGAAAGGGVGLYGRGDSGIIGATFEQLTTMTDDWYNGNPWGGPGGSSGTAGSNTYKILQDDTGLSGGLFGGGGGGGGDDRANGSTSAVSISRGGQGGVRLLWGTGRAFPATKTGFVDSSSEETVV